MAEALGVLGALWVSLIGLEWLIGTNPSWLARMPGLALDTRIVEGVRLREALVQRVATPGAYRGKLDPRLMLATWPRAATLERPTVRAQDVPYGVLLRPTARWRAMEAARDGARARRPFRPLPFAAAPIHLDATWTGGNLVLRTRWIPWPLASLLTPALIAAGVLHTAWRLYGVLLGHAVLVGVAAGVFWAFRLVRGFLASRRSARALVRTVLDDYQAAITAERPPPRVA